MRWETSCYTARCFVAMQLEPDKIDPVKVTDFLLNGLCCTRLRDEAGIVLLELLENASKYAPKKYSIVKIKVFSHANGLQIRITNVLDNPEHFEKFREIMQEILATEDKTRLYARRIKEIFGARGPDGGILGLYRICCETGFGLTFRVHNNSELEVIAERKGE